MQTMRALILEKPFRVSLRDLPKPTPSEGEALVRVLSAGICGSEIHAYHGKHAKRIPPAVMGHEVCGVVEGLGAGASGPTPGTRVVVLPQRACGGCHWCLHGMPNLCDAKVMLGETSWAGGYAEYFTTPVELLYPIAEEVPDDVATLVEPLSVAVHAVRRSGIGLGDKVLVMGAGAIGLTTVLAARQAGAGTVLTTDLFDYNLDRAREAGATHCLNVRDTDPVKLALEISEGLGLDAAFMAADAPNLFDQAVRSVRKQGSITLIAMFPEPRTVNLQMPKAMEHVIQGSLTFTPEDFQIALDTLQRSQENVRTVITHRLSLEQGQRAFELVDKHSEDLVRVVLKP